MLERIKAKYFKYEEDMYQMRRMVEADLLISVPLAELEAQLSDEDCMFLHQHDNTCNTIQNEESTEWAPSPV